LIEARKILHLGSLNQGKQNKNNTRETRKASKILVGNQNINYFSSALIFLVCIAAL
jgi:hypothetical protein